MKYIGVTSRWIINKKKQNPESILLPKENRKKVEFVEIMFLKIYETKSPKSTLLADNTEGLIATKQTKDGKETKQKVPSPLLWSLSGRPWQKVLAA